MWIVHCTDIPIITYAGVLPKSVLNELSSAWCEEFVKWRMYRAYLSFGLLLFLFTLHYYLHVKLPIHTENGRLKIPLCGTTLGYTMETLLRQLLLNKEIDSGYTNIRRQ